MGRWRPTDSSASGGGVAMCGMAVALHNRLDVVAYTSNEWDDYD